MCGTTLSKLGRLFVGALDDFDKTSVPSSAPPAADASSSPDNGAEKVGLSFDWCGQYSLLCLVILAVRRGISSFGWAM